MTFCTQKGTIRLVDGVTWHNHSRHAWEIVIYPSRQLYSTYPWSSIDVIGSTIGVFDNEAWSTDSHEWDVCCAVPYRTVSPALRLPKHLHFDLQCIGLSAEQLSEADFAVSRGTVSDIILFDDQCTSNPLVFTAGFTVIYPLCINANKGRLWTT